MQECSGNFITTLKKNKCMEAALEYGAAPSLFTKGLPEALPTEAAEPIRIGAQGVRKACCSERRCGHERRLARS